MWECWIVGLVDIGACLYLQDLLANWIRIAISTITQVVYASYILRIYERGGWPGGSSGGPIDHNSRVVMLLLGRILQGVLLLPFSLTTSFRLRGRQETCNSLYSAFSPFRHAGKTCCWEVRFGGVRWKNLVWMALCIWRIIVVLTLWLKLHT